MNDRLAATVRACLTNGNRLLDDAEYVELNEPPTTAYFLAMIAQEEIAKGFLLALVVRGIIPWDKRLLRAARDHTCKQLLCVVMDYLVPGDDDWFARVDTMMYRPEEAKLPREVADALNILRHEKIGCWADYFSFWAENPDYDPGAMAIFAGKKDRVKQDALYVRLSADGSVASTPAGVTLETVKNERDRARRLASLTNDMLNGDPNQGLDYPRIEESIRILFASMPDDVRGKKK